MLNHLLPPGWGNMAKAIGLKFLFLVYWGFCPNQGIVQAQYAPLDFGQVVHGFQDDFNCPTRDPNWVSTPPDQDCYAQAQGVLKATVKNGDPNHLLYAVPGYDEVVQEVLAKIKVTAFGTGDDARAGIGIATSTNDSQGLNLVLCDMKKEGVPGRQCKLLNDYLAWGPASLTLRWKTNTWYWLRLGQTGNGDLGAPNVRAKAWLADGTVPEPAGWQLNWNQRGRSGLAGILGSAGGLSEFEVDYILIKAEGLPEIKVGPEDESRHWLRTLHPPRDITAGTGQWATLSVAVDSSDPPAFQWEAARPEPARFVAITGATQADFRTPILTATDHGTRYRCVITTPANRLVSRAAAVRIDTVPPNLVSARTFGSSNQVTVVFSETIADPAGLAHFTINNGIRVLQCKHEAGSKAAQLTITPIEPGKEYLLTVNGIQDACGNVIHPASSLPIDPIPKDTFWFIPHTHWEGAVFITRENYLDMGLPNILAALKLLKSDLDYRFTLDQVCYVRPFLERYPELVADFRKLVAEGRLQIVGGTDTMHDNNIPSGESLVRQMLYGKTFFRDQLGIDVTVGWGLDTFGHNAQIPQLLKLGGYKSFWFARGVPESSTPSEFLWQGIDGTQIPAFWLPNSYAVLYGSPGNLAAFKRFCEDRFKSLNPHSRGSDRVGLAGADVSEPEQHVPRLVKEFNAQSESPFRLRLAVPTEYESVVTNRPGWPVLKGERNPIFQGGYSSRIELKQKMRNVERLLISGEKLQALWRWFGESGVEENIWRAWEPVLFNQAHDLMSGVMTDTVYEDTMRGYDFSQRLAEELVGTGLKRLSAKVDTQGEGIPLVVFNSLGWPRTDVVEADVGFAATGIKELGVLDSEAREIPVEILEAERYHDGGLKRARIIFLAREVPGLGCETFRVIPANTTTSTKSQDQPASQEGVIENEFYRATLDLFTGELVHLEVKRDRWEVLAGPGNVVARQHDGGDLWELYRNLNGGMNIGSKRQQPVPKPGQALFSQERGKRGDIRRGQVFSEVKVAHGFGTNGTFATSVRLYAGVPRIDFRTQILNQEKNVRYQVLFPTTIQGGRNIQEIPFGAIERPLAVEYPAQNWSDYGDGQKGVALLNRGLPGNLVSENTLMLSLMRSARIAAYGYGGGYGPGMSSDTGLELGRELTFHYALAPHAGSWQQARVFRHGMEFNNPLFCVKTEPHPGPLPKRWEGLTVSPANLVLSAFKPGRDGSTIVRVYEAAGIATAGAVITCKAPLRAAQAANLMEDTGSDLAVASENQVRLDFAPFEIKTLKLKVQSAK